MVEVLILGGGLTALSAGYELSKEGFKVRILEQNSVLGGLARYFSIENTWLESYYHHIFTSNDSFLKLANEMGLINKIFWKKTLMGFYYENEIYRATPFNLLFNFKPLKYIDKFKFALCILKILRKKDWEDLDSITVKDWVIDEGSKRLYDIIFKPLLKVKWGRNSDQISASWLWGRMKPRVQSRSKGGLSEKLGYMKVGFKGFIENLIFNIQKRGGKIETNCDVSKILMKDGSISGIEYKKNGKDKKLKSNLVISTIPIPIFLDITPDLPSDYRTQLKKIKYESVICAVLSLKKKLSDIYWLNICSDLPFGGLIEHTNFVEPETYGNQNIVYLFNYIDKKDRLWKMTEKELINKYVEGVKEIFPKFNEIFIRWFRIFRDVYATPVYKINYKNYMPTFRTPINGLYISGTFLSYPLNRNMDTSLKMGLKVANIISKNFQ